MITLKQGQYLPDVMDEIPSNCILSKRIPGCGATTLELTTKRNSIIVVPNVPVIVSKSIKHPNMLGVSEGVTHQSIIHYLQNNNVYKIMTTPESFAKIKFACDRRGIDIYTEFFLLMDECHQLVKDVDYRPDMVVHMNDFFRFKHKALVSATPIEFSDPRFEENYFRTIEVNADYDYRQEITVTHTYNIAQAVEEYMESHNGKICFFVNSVAEIYSIIKKFDLINDSVIYCADKSKKKLKREYGFINTHTSWSVDTMKKYSFFTGRFFTAFDMDLEYKPDVVMITDPYHSPYSILDIETDCIQICGRFRNGINSVTHIYRANPQIIVKDRAQIEWEISAHEFAYTTVKTLYDNADSKEGRFAFDAALKSLPFRDFLYPDFTKNWFAIDNKINEVLVQGKYQSRITAWYNSCFYFRPTFTYCEYDKNAEKLEIIRSARSVKEKRRQFVQYLSEMEEPHSEYALDFTNEMRKIDPFIVDAYDALGKERIEALRYSQRKIKEEMILQERYGNKVIRLIKNRFTVGRHYKNDTIVKEISKIFEKLNIHPEKEIKPSIILDYYQAAPYKSNDKRGYYLVSELV